MTMTYVIRFRESFRAPRGFERRAGHAAFFNPDSV